MPNKTEQQLRREMRALAVEYALIADEMDDPREDMLERLDALFKRSEMLNAEWKEFMKKNSS